MKLTEAEMRLVFQIESTNQNAALMKWKSQQSAPLPSVPLRRKFILEASPEKEMSSLSQNTQHSSGHSNCFVTSQ